MNRLSQDVQGGPSGPRSADMLYVGAIAALVESYTKDNDRSARSKDGAFYCYVSGYTEQQATNGDGPLCARARAISRWYRHCT